MKKLLVMASLALVMSMSFAIPASAVEVDAHHGGDVTKMIGLDKMVVETAFAVPSAPSVHADAAVESNPKIETIGFSTDRDKFDIASCNAKSERLSNTRLNL